MKQLTDLQPGQGGIISYNNQEVAAYRKKDGVTVLLSPICTHQGCTVEWNAQESSWDCPCHGSRFDAEGTVINGPARDPLSAIQK